jgi:exopolysaccharide biosynthesis polyprenyl glycosylphosphotransferase
MLRRDRQLRTQVYQLKDAALFALGLWLAHWIRFNVPGELLGWRFDPIDPFDKFVWLYLIIIPGAPFILESQGFYARPLFASRRETAWRLLKGCALITVGVILAMFLFRETAARGVIVLFGFVSFALVFSTEELLRLTYKSRFGEVQFKKRVILVGAREDTQRMREDLRARKLDNLEVLAEFDLNESVTGDLVRLLHETSANSVIINAKHTYFGQVEKAIHACEIEGVETWLVADFFKTHVSQTSFDDFYGRPVLVFRSAPEASWQGVFKQALDLAVAFVLLLFLTPLVLVPVAVAIRLSSPGPVLFRQKRCGLNGRPFTMLKFRSMVSNAEQRKHELAALNEMGGPVFKVTNDPRITPIGRWLRKYSLDEFPQLFNVLRGEMSLVGPRPLPVDEVSRFDDPAHRRRLSVKPGLTCLWQVSGRNEVRDFRDWVRLDLEYIDNWSFWLDLKILWRTIPVVLTGAGAK